MMIDEQQTQEQKHTETDTDEMLKAAEAMSELLKGATRSLADLGSVKAIAGWASMYASELYRVQLRILNTEMDTILGMAAVHLKEMKENMKADPDEDWADDRMMMVDIAKEAAVIRGQAAERSMRFAAEITGHILRHYAEVRRGANGNASAVSAVTNAALVSEMSAYMEDARGGKDSDKTEEELEDDPCPCSGCRQEREDSTTPG